MENLRWWEVTFTMRKAKGSIASLAYGTGKLIPALFIMSAFALGSSLFLPFVKVTKLFIFSEQITLIDAIGQLIKSGEVFIALVVVLFSIVFPVLKLCVIDYVWRGCDVASDQLIKGMKILEVAGKWSMLDVFVAALVVFSVKASVIANATSEIGLYLFATSVLLSMIGVMMVRKQIGKIQEKTNSTHA